MVLKADQEALLHNWEAEVFIFLDQDLGKLAVQLLSLREKLDSLDDAVLKDLAFTINCATVKKNTEHIRLGLVAQSIDDLKGKISLAAEALLSGRPFYDVIPLAQSREIYFADHTEVATGKLAFILPGLGASYPNMLADLCLHFPDVKEVFDFVDDLAAKTGSTELPSQRIFSSPNAKITETSASLAAMDSAVITVLMTEWALFTLLQKLKIVPDVLLGASTGEFAALVMSGAIDILLAAPIFYHLSTSVARSIPQERLAELRSLQVLAPYEVIKPYLNCDSVYLSADLSESQILISGNKTAIEKLAQEFEAAGIQDYMLPTAIPYHTPLVEGIIDADRQEILDLPMNTPQIPTWSCSTAAPYPSDPKVIKEATTRLFSQPILFRDSIEALYANGVRKFVEVGPKGMLTGFISEILSGKPHLAIASNRSAYSAILQLNHVLAALFCQGVSMDLNYLYARRTPRIIDFKQESPKPSQPVQLSLPVETEENEVIASYLQTVATFQKQLMNVQEEIMSSYLKIGNNELDESDYINWALLNPKWQDYITAPESFYLSDPVSQIGGESGVVGRTIKDDVLPIDEEALASCIDYILSPSEIDILGSWSNVAKRREWLLGRIVAKEAVRHLVKQLFDVSMPASDFEIYSDKDGKPIVLAIKIADKKFAPIISISHKNGVAMAVATIDRNGIGVDIETIEPKEDGFENLLLNESELLHFKDELQSNRNVFLSKMWTVKEAVGKTLGKGLAGNPKNLRVISADSKLAEFQVESSDASEAISVSCRAVGETIISWSVL